MMSFWILPLISILSVNPDSTQIRAYKFAATPIWRDEFDKDGLPDSEKWGYDVGAKYMAGEIMNFNTIQMRI